MSKSLVCKLPLLVLALSPTVAFAEELGFVTMDRAAPGSAVGAQVGYHAFSDDAYDRVTAMRFEVFGHHQFAGQPFGAYGQIAMAQLLVDDGEDFSALGNLEVGGFWAIRRPTGDLVLRAGLSLATADDDFEGFLTNAQTMVERLVDITNIIPDTTWLRISASPIVRRGSLFFRADLGLDIPLDEVVEDVLFHANAAIGARSGSLSVAGELVTVGNLTSDGDLDERTFTTGALTLRTDLGQVRPYASIILPLDEELRGEVIVFALGAQVALD